MVGASCAFIVTRGESVIVVDSDIASIVCSDRGSMRQSVLFSDLIEMLTSSGPMSLT